MKYAVACCMARDEPDLREWAVYHLSLGFEHIYIYDNESRRPAGAAVSDMVVQGSVTIIQVQGKKRQVSVYADALSRCSARWVAFLDADEFLNPHHVNDIRRFLEAFESVSAVGINWQIFGDGAHIRRPEGLLLGNYTMRGVEDYWENRHVKSIVNPREAIWPANPHCFFLKNNQVAVDPTGEVIPFDFCHHQAFRFPPVVAEIQINHYYTRSEEDFRAKQLRGGGAGAIRKDEVLDTIRKSCNRISDTRITRFNEMVRARMLGRR